MDTPTSRSVATTPLRFDDIWGPMNTMRTRLEFSLKTSKDGFHIGGRGVRKTRSDGERDSANARGDGWLRGRGANSRQGSMMTTSCCLMMISMSQERRSSRNEPSLANRRPHEPRRSKP
jgi:hypothetical protein